MVLSAKKGTILIFRPLKMTFRANQPNISYDMLFMSFQRRRMPKRVKTTSAFLRSLPLLKVDNVNT